jgi:hypothetical protein
MGYVALSFELQWLYDRWLEDDSLLGVVTRCL